MIQYASGAIASCISCLANGEIIEQILFSYWEFEGRNQIAFSVLFGAVLTRCPAKVVAISRYKSQIGLAPHSVPFLLDWECEARKYKSPL